MILNVSGPYSSIRVNTLLSLADQQLRAYRNEGFYASLLSQEAHYLVKFITDQDLSLLVFLLNSSNVCRGNLKRNEGSRFMPKWSVVYLID